MATVFFVCAVIGGTVLAFQILLMLVGLGGHFGDADMPHDFHGDVGGTDFHGDAGGGDVHDAGAHTGDTDHSSAATHLFKVLSFRTIVAALTFFGLGGMAADQAGASTPVTLLIACAAGAAALYGVFWVIQSIMSLQSEGTARVERSVGAPGTVYLRIPASREGQGKVHVLLQSRTMEYQAVTSGDALPAGAKVVVVDVLGPDTVEVAPVQESERSDSEDV